MDLLQSVVLGAYEALAPLPTSRGARESLSVSGRPIVGQGAIVAEVLRTHPELDAHVVNRVLRSLEHEDTEMMVHVELPNGIGWACTVIPLGVTNITRNGEPIESTK